MASLILPSRLTQQPQYPARVDWSNPVTRGLAFAVMPGKELTDATKNLRVTQSGNGRSVKIRRGGVGALAADSTSFLQVNGVSLGTAFSLFSVQEFSSGATQSPIDDDDSSTRNFQYRLNTSNQVEFILFTTGGTYVNSGTTLSTSEISAPSVMAATADGGSNSIAVWGNGRKTTLATTGTYPTLSSTIGLLNRKGGTPNPTTAPVYLTLAWSRVLSDSEILSLTANPWQVFAAPPRRLWLAASSGGTTSGALAWLEQNDTTAITGAVTTVGSLAWTEASDGGAINATVTNAGSLAWTEANDANALSATVTNAGTLGWTEANDATSISATVTNASSLAWTEASDTTAISGTVTSSGATLSWTEQNDANALSATVTNAGSLAWTEQNDVTAINAAQPVPATLSWTEQNDTCAIIGAALVAGSLAWAEQDDFTQIVAKGPSTGGGADYGDKKKRRKVIIDGKQYKVTEPELASLLAIKQEEAEQASQKAAKAVAKVTKPAAQAISENAADAVLMRRIADDLADEDEMEDLLMMLL